LGLLEQQRLYCKQRGTIKWVKFGDAGTKFFHTNATIKHGRNLISNLINNDDTVLSDHKEKEKILWEDFKIRLRTFEFEGFFVVPEFFILNSVNLSMLEGPFSQEKIDNVIKNLPTSPLTLMGSIMSS
jgi:hypothetical protein